MIIERFFWMLIVGIALAYFFISVPFPQKGTLGIIMAIAYLCLIGGLLFTANKAFQNMGYALRKHDFVFRKGWLFERLSIVPLKKIQHCQIKRNPLERNFGLATIRIYTAGGAGVDIAVSGLTYEEAETIKEWLVASPKDSKIQNIESESDGNYLG